MTLYNPCFEITALVFLCAIMFFFFYRHKRHAIADKIFSIFLIIIFINLATDIMTAYILANARAYSLITLYVVNTLYYMTLYMAPSFFVMYIMAVTNPEYSINDIAFNIFMIPVASGVISLIMNPITRSYFYFDDMRNYLAGPWKWLLQGNAVFYFFIGILYALTNRKRIDSTMVLSIYTIIIVNCIMTSVQLVFPQYLLTGVGATISLFVIYLNIQNPDIYIDQLMKIQNRAAFVMSIREMLRKKEKFEAVIVALDSFKMINDVFGIQNGDLLLKTMADKMEKLVNQQDIFRYSGDTIAILFTDNTEREEKLNQLIDKIQELFEEPWCIDNLSVKISAGICVVYSSNHNEETKGFISAIDYSLIEAKKMGHGGLYREDDVLLAAMQRKTTIEHVLADMIEQGNMEVFFQPIYSVKTGEFISSEALARLRVPGYGYVPPSEFITMAEKNGRISELGFLILEEVCKTITDNNLSDTCLKYVEVNLSVAQCIQDRFSDQIINIVDKYNLPHNMINLEVTETVAAYSEKILSQNMERLSESGISFSLDDYGTGYSTVSYISKLPFNIVKLDKEIVQNAMEDESGHIILSSSIDMLKKLNLKIIAEGVETQEQAKSVIDMNVDYIQGFYYAKPMPAEEYVEFLRNRSK